MKIVRRIKAMRAQINKIKSRHKAIGFVPTMGALHEGHLRLIRRARRENDCAIVSIFVNPIQFGPKEDFRKYPMNLREDYRLCKKEGVDIIFYPEVSEIYHRDHRTYVAVDGLSERLCGKFRPGHFRGVTTVVTKLFNIVQPDIAYFGQKDAQQAVIIKKMVDNLNIPVRIRVIPTLREKDGLAMSSRNVYLSAKERKDALVLYQALNQAKKLIKRGVRDSRTVIRQMKSIIEKKNNARVDYISIVRLDNLELLDKVINKSLIALAVRFGSTRLIDNCIIG